MDMNKHIFHNISRFMIAANSLRQMKIINEKDEQAKNLEWIICIQVADKNMNKQFFQFHFTQNAKKNLVKMLQCAGNGSLDGMDIRVLSRSDFQAWYSSLGATLTLIKNKCLVFSYVLPTKITTKGAGNNWAHFQKVKLKK